MCGPHFSVDDEFARDIELDERYAPTSVHPNDLGFSALVGGVLIRQGDVTVALAVDLPSARATAATLGLDGLTLHPFSARIETVDDTGYPA